MVFKRNQSPILDEHTPVIHGRFRWTALLFVALTTFSGQALQAQVKKSLVVGIDGLGYGTKGLSVAATPWLDHLIEGTWQPGYQGAYTDAAFSGGVLGAPTQQTTVSGPGWTTMLTAVWTDRHRVTGNGSSFANGRFQENPPYLGIVKAWDNSLNTASFVNWAPIDTYIIDSIDTDGDDSNDLNVRGVFATDLQVMQAAAAAIRSSRQDRDVVFVSFDEVDQAGHAHGGSGDGYQLKIEVIDEYVGQLLNAIANRSTFEDEDWQIVITSDHGHRPAGGHGGQTVLERTIPFIVVGTSVHQGRLPAGVSQADVAPTVLDHFGAPIPAHFWGRSRARGGAVYFDDFENVQLKPFTEISSGGNQVYGFVPAENISSWVVTNNFLNGFVCQEEAYDGWHVLDQDEWICEQNGQNRNQNGTLGNAGQRNALLVADPDAADDYSSSTGASPTNYNSTIHHDYDLSGVDLASLSLSLDFELRCEDSQRSIIEVSFDQGASYQTLLDASVGSGCANGEIINGPAIYLAGVDFFPPQGATSMRIRFGCIEAGNDWWFAVDNVSLDDNSGNLYFEDFEGREMESFSVGGACGDPPSDDGTDFAGDVVDEIPGWAIDNSEMLAVSLEEGFNGWRAIDANRWVEHQGTQIGRSQFLLTRPTNTIMLADPDAFYDFVDSDSPPPTAFHSYVYRTYDLSGLDPESIEISMRWEFATFALQQGSVDVRFDLADDPSWQPLFRLDSANLAANQVFSDTSGGVDSDGRLLKGAWSHLEGDFSACGPKLTVRIACLEGGNDWWFAFDDLAIYGDAQGFLTGDASDDGTISFGDLGPFILALSDPASYQLAYPNVNVDEQLDMNCDGSFNFGDINGFLNLILSL